MSARQTPRHAHPPQIEAFLEMLLAERGAARNTVEAYGRDLDDYTAFLARAGETPVSADAQSIRRYLAHMAGRNLAPRTVQRRLSALRQLHRFIAAEGIRPTTRPSSSMDRSRAARCRKF